MNNSSANYSLILWIVYVFLGGAIDALVIKNFIGWYLAITQFNEANLPSLILYVLLVFFTPVILSFFFSRKYPEKRIAPPLYMQIVAFGLLSFFVYSEFFLNLGMLYILVVYAWSAGVAQDWIVVYAFGKAALADGFVKYSLKVHADITKVQEIIMNKQFRNRLGLKKIVRRSGESLKLRTPRARDIQIVMELKEGIQSGETIINLVAYEEKGYSIKKSDDAQELAIGRIVYLKDAFRRLYSVQVDDDSSDSADSLVNYVLDEMQGTVTRFQEMTAQKRIFVIASISLFFVMIGLLLYGKIEPAIATFAIVVVLIIEVIRRE